MPGASLIPYAASQDETLIDTWLKTKRSMHTQNAYKRDIHTFYAFTGKRLAEVTLPDIQAYAAYLRDEKHYEPSTQARMLAAVKSLCTFAKNTGNIPFNVGEAQLLPEGKDKLAQRILSKAQVDRLLYEAEKASPRNRLMLLLLYGSGIRCAELCGLQWMDVQETPQGGQITVLGKRSKTRAIALHPTVWKALQAFRPGTARSDDYVFQSRQTSIRNGKPSRRLRESQVWRIVATIAEKAGIRDAEKHVSPHWFRHAHATHAMQRNTPLKVIQETLGHADLRTPARYQHVMPEVSSSLSLEL
jgi:site-specific recombinase XerD